MNGRGVWPLLTLSSYLIQIKKCESLKLTNILKVKMNETTYGPCSLSHHKLHLFAKYWTLDGNEMAYISKRVLSNVILSFGYRSGLM